MRHFVLWVTVSALVMASDTVSIANLEWQDNAQVKTTKLGWQDAKEHCQALSLVGHNDWRLPNIKELQSIVNVGHYNPAIKKSFKHVASSGYWSSSQDVSGAKDAWVVSFKVGRTSNRTKSNVNYVRCVRHRQ